MVKMSNIFKSKKSRAQRRGQKHWGEHMSREAGPQKLCKTQEGRHVGTGLSWRQATAPLCGRSWTSRRESDVGKQNFAPGWALGSSRMKS